MLTIRSQFSSGRSAVGLGYDPTRDEIIVYGSFQPTLDRFTTTGAAVGTFANPGETANDYDVDVADVPLSLAGVAVAAGSALLINGENGVAEIRAVDPVTGTVLATLVTAFGVSHVVGGAYHAQRGTFFLVQDKVPGGTAANRVAEIDATTGAVLNTFQIPASAAFTVNFGDLEVEPITGELMVVSSDEASVLRMAPTGEVLGTLALPSLGGLSGIALAADGTGFVVDTGGQVTWLSGFLGDGAIVGTAARNRLSGSDAGETLAGLGGNDTLNAGAGADRLYGGAGKDRLVGGVGDDLLAGGAGTDVLTGGRGADTFVFGAGDTGARAKAADTIADFSQAQSDRIDLSGIDAVETTAARDAFTFIGTDVFSGTAGELRYRTDGGDTLILGDTDGDRKADLMIRLTGAVALSADDFGLGETASPGAGGAAPFGIVLAPDLPAF